MSYDFEKNHQRANDFRRDCDDFFETNIHILHRIILDPDTRQSLTDIEITNSIKTLHLRNVTSLKKTFTESSYVYSRVAVAMHALAIPTTIVWQNKRWKPSIDTSKECFFRNATDKDSMLSMLQVHLRSCDKKKLQRYPIIYGIGEDEENLSEYVVATSDVIYTFSTFLEAMDAAFKCFVFYNITFPPQVIRFWSLINSIFYKIINPQLKLTSSLSAILKSFD